MRLLLAFLVALAPALAWGQKGHRLAAEASLGALPPELRAWYAGREAEYGDAALEPDRRKAGDRKEGPRHYLNPEAYGGMDRVPRDPEQALDLVGPRAFAKGGQLPWAIQDRYRALVAAFRSGDAARIASDSGWLCHYAADAQVPLHTSRDHNGKETGQKGIHARWETGLVERRVEAAPRVRPAQRLADPGAAAFLWAARAHGLVAALLAADLEAEAQAVPKRRGLPPGADYWSLFWRLQGPAVEGQLRHAAEGTADLLLTAWLEAGSPRRP